MAYQALNPNGQATMANSSPVVLASDQASIPVAATLAAETTKVIGTTRTLGNAGAILDGVNTAATAPANGVLGLGIYNSTEPSPTTGQSVGIQQDSKGRLRNVIMDAAGNTRGANVNASNQLSVSVDNTVTVASHAVTIASGGVASGAIASGAVASGAVASGAFASGSIAAGAVAAGATSFVKLEDVASADADAGVPALAVRKATPANTSGTDGDYEFLQMSAGRLWASSNIDQINGVTPLMGNGATGTGALRVSIANDSTGIVQLVPGTTGGLTTFHLASAGSTNATNVKASAGQLYGYMVSNTSAAYSYLCFHNTSGTPTAGASIFFKIGIPTGGAANVEFTNGVAFSSGIGISTVTGAADSNTTAVAANDLIINLFYK